MDITATQAAGAPPAAAATKSSIGSDLETFLKMLTVQMRNQDPLNPMEASDFAVQLATFSGVEQQVQTNQLLQGLSAQMGMMGMGQFASWVGMEARAAAPAHYAGDPLTLLPAIPMIADKATLIVRNAMGKEVDRMDVALDAESVQWSGFGEDGAPLPEGAYSFELASYKDDKLLAVTQVPHYALVQEARLENGTPMLILEGGIRVPSNSIHGLRPPS